MKLIDTHIHTIESSRCATVSAKEQVKLYKEAGYDAIFITDHLYTRHSKKFYGYDGTQPWSYVIDKLLLGYRTALEEGKKLGLEVFLGVELHLDDHDNDYLVYGIDEDFLYKHENLQRHTLPEISKITHDNGLLLIQAHPFRPHITRDYLDFVDGIEVFNGHPSHIEHNEKAYALAREKNLLMTSGSDCHHLERKGINAIGTSGMLFYDDIKSGKDFVEAVKKLRYKLIFDPRIE